MNPVRHTARAVWKNPIFLRYCRSRLRARGLGVWLLIALLIATFIVAMANSIGVRIGVEPADAARNGVIPLLVLQCVILFGLGTAQVAGGMVAERDEGVIDYQRLIPMTPLAKVIGYVFGLPVREYIIVLATMPFTAWSLWKGEVGWRTWLPLYTAVFSSTLLYHFTGLLTGTVVKNRRWAFLICIILVSCLYTVIPQLSKFGLVFFKYLTITPVVTEALPNLLPVKTGAMVRAAQHFVPTVKFFNLNLSELVFTLFSQGGLILTFIVMLCRKWRRDESHLMGKLWALGFFVWIQILLLGNALPTIEPGSIFPSRGFSYYVGNFQLGDPTKPEATMLCGIYGTTTLALLFVLGGMITPAPEHQLRGWRRARKQGATKLPWLADAATSFWFVLAMALAGAAGWYVFTRGIVESRWFPGHTVAPVTFVHFAAVLVACGCGSQALLEAKGGRAVGFAAVFIGIVPIMAGSVLGAMDERFAALSTWLVGMSPISQPMFGAATLLTIADLPNEVARPVPRAFYFWLLIASLVAPWLALRLRSARRAIAKRVMGAN